MDLYLKPKDYHPWIDVSNVNGVARDEPFLSELAQELAWPQPITAAFGNRIAMLQNLGVGSGDYVILPNLSPVAWAQAAMALGADCILMDHDPEHWQMDLDLLEEFLMNYTMLNERDELILKKDSRIIRAIVVPHLLGGMCDMDRLVFIGQRFNVALGEDITHGLGSRWKDQPAGSFGRINFCAFLSNPIVPFGRSVIFTSQDNVLKKAPTEAYVLEQMGEDLGWQLVWHVRFIIESFRKREAGLRNLSITADLQWMSPLAENQTNGMSIAFTSQRAMSETAPPPGRLKPPIYHQLPFKKSLYIRREDWSSKLYETARVFPMHFSSRDLEDQIKAYLSE
ncbi:DegT/DnrJ/EryC1/StrS family aminotransferase [Flavilitoribacter nigricans]|uniref:DegT/DnrJ/EryC1/StrS aminotransferase family protein n=1 Tax=Flavilitoribacter nigricans (strain ATCC 23147 / DSM 23189 / NBRC 102662 / NCIMB 1420 / SS-2) TaxID=1122177 RepID=A0A2D0NGH1_FLAN2|nr:DegT/DnrJ/EryC1/StrS family aminotransferase [Flavilitoribacter nigricans]PHN07269.1 hypothetical protein CRP01_06465 [Flavilitoribacter nigricans DSM 23189 = NBRC 102662]